MKGKIVYQTEPMKIEVREHEFSEEVEAGSLLLEVLQTNVCGSELHVFKGHHPTLKCGVIGHEMIGRIAKLGDNVKTDNAGNPVQVGDRVVPVYFVTCNQCRECLAGNLHHCIHMYKYQGQSGTFASYYTVHHDQYFFSKCLTACPMRKRPVRTALSPKSYSALTKSISTRVIPSLFKGPADWD